MLHQAQVMMWIGERVMRRRRVREEEEGERGGEMGMGMEVETGEL